MIRITLNRGEERRIRGGHPWIFNNEIASVAGERAPGIAAEVYDAGGSYLGTGHYNPHSLISVRLLTISREEIENREFFVQRIERALAFRRSVYPHLDSFRVVYGEADGLSGLVIDKFGECIVLQILSAGMERQRDLIVSAVEEIFSPRAVVARNDVSVRALEGLGEYVEVLGGEVPERLTVEENGLHFLVDVTKGQKTGHFLDQKENHLLLRQISPEKDVLDCFCYSGSWGIHAAAFGAASVTCVDISGKAIALAAENAALNGVSDVMAFEVADVFERLRSLKHERRTFDIVVMDPPAFVKSKKALREAQKGYLTINRRAMELLRPGGYLVTCSCSYHMGREMFRDLLKTAAQQAGVDMRVVAVRSQAPDHPVILSIPETEYLKCFVLQAVGR